MNLSFFSNCGFHVGRKNVKINLFWFQSGIEVDEEEHLSMGSEAGLNTYLDPLVLRIRLRFILKRSVPIISKGVFFLIDWILLFNFFDVGSDLVSAPTTVYP